MSVAPTSAPVARPQPRPKGNRKLFWLTQFRQWHWISGAICLVGILLFSLTGITLNHAADIESKPVVTTREATLPDALIAALAKNEDRAAPLPDAVARFIDDQIGISVAGRPGEWSDEEIYVGLPRPGGDAFLTVGRSDGAVFYERTDRGWVSYLNDLHKGRNTGAAWSWFLDIFALACIVFSMTGLALLYLYARGRRSTWPLVGAGLVIPMLLAIVFIH
ncbi:MAG: PepSY-associated TM helix domain-containing protein [Micropepsaceae bacterium]